MTILRLLYNWRLAMALALSALATACGGNGVIIPHQTGNFSNASFKGSYVYQIHGFISVNGNPYREVGVITADGNGNITGGLEDVATVGTGGATASGSITGTYSISGSGMGQIVLNSTALGALVGSQQIAFAVTLVSTSEAQLEEGDLFADGAGDAELQDTTAIGAAPGGAFVFRLHEDSNAGGASESEVGAITIASNGSFTGNMDQHLVSSSTSLTLTGSAAAPGSLGSGTGTFTDSTNVATTFIYFIVNSGKFALLTSNGVTGSGSAEAQSGAVSSGLAGTYVFGSRGDDVSTGTAAFATVGQFTGSGATISAGALDSMQDGNYAQQATKFSGTANGTPTAQGRVQVTLSSGPVMVFWLVSPSRAFFLIEGESATEDGTTDLQTTNSFSASTVNGQFALTMDGIDLAGGQAVARSGTLQFDGTSKTTLVEIVNDSGSGTGAQNPGPLAGTYQVGGSGRITTQMSNSGGGLDLVMYSISGSQAYALQTDSGENTSGIMQLQQ